MSVPTKHTAVILMLCVTTPRDPITARVKMDFMVMEKNVKVIIAIHRMQIWRTASLVARKRG